MFSIWLARTARIKFSSIHLLAPRRISDNLFAPSREQSWERFRIFTIYCRTRLRPGNLGTGRDFLGLLKF